MGDSSLFLPGVRAVLFDLDGTLVDTEAQIAAAVTETLAGFGYPVSQQTVHALAGRTLRDWFTGSLGMASDEAERVYHAYVHHTVERYAYAARPMLHANNLLQLLLQQRLHIAILTTRVEESARAVLDAVGWSDVFALVVAQQTAARTKPAPDPALYALARLNVTPEQAVRVGNTEADMGCGVAAGLRAVIGVVGERSAAVLQASGATHICGSLAGVRAMFATAASIDGICES